MYDIIIPCYHSHSTLDRCIGSILYQTWLDKCKVTLVNDGGKDDYSVFINRYKDCVNIQELKYDKNRGPGFARAYGIQHTNYSQIIFIDADDVFASPFTVQTLGTCFEEDPKVKIVISSILEERPGQVPIEYKDNRNFMHGKMYDRIFLERNDFYGNIDSKICEDAGFNAVVLNLVDDVDTKIKSIPFISYYWMANKNSLGRKDPEKWEYYYVPIGCVDNFIFTAQELEKRNIDNEKFLIEITRNMIHCILLWISSKKSAPLYIEHIKEQTKRYYTNIYNKYESNITDEIFTKACMLYSIKGDTKEYQNIIKKYIKGLLDV